MATTAASESAAVSCRAVVPAFNEARRIWACLDHLAAARLPDGHEWREWVVLDGASTDGTAAVARAWAMAHPDIRLRVETEPERRGKASSLGSYHSRLLEAEAGHDIVLVCDADGAVDREAIHELLVCLRDEERLGVVWGVDEPDDVRIGRWASAFQMKAVRVLTRCVGLRMPRAYGALFAYRVNALAGFSWSAGELTDDCQLARHVTEQAIPVLTRDSAVIRRTPAGSFRDVYLQTFKYYAAKGLGEATPAPRRSLRLAAFSTVARQHPCWAGAYLFALAVCHGRHRIAPTAFSGLWEPPSSTKGVAAGRQEGARMLSFGRIDLAAEHTQLPGASEEVSK